MPSGAQVRAARAILGISAKDLAKLANIGWATVQRLESQDLECTSRGRTALLIRAALEAKGIEFIGDPEKNPGVILHRP